MEEEGSFEEQEEHVLVQLEGFSRALTQEGVPVVLEGFPEHMEQEVRLRLGKQTFRGNMEPVVGTALVFRGTDTAAPVCVTQMAVLHSGSASAAKPKGGGKKKAVARKGRKRKPASDEEDDEDYHE